MIIPDGIILTPTVGNVIDASIILKNKESHQIFGMAIEFCVKDGMHKAGIQYQLFESHDPVDFAIGNMWYDVKYSEQKNTHTISLREFNAWNERLSKGLDTKILSFVKHGENSAKYMGEISYASLIRDKKIKDSKFGDTKYFFI